MHIGLFFGSFNPIHLGHLIIAEYMLEYAHFEKVWFVVSPQNPFKVSHSLCNDKQRVDWVKACIDNNPKLEACDVELSLSKPSYTIHTLKHLEDEFPANRFSLIMGSDNLEKLHLWKDFQKIIDKHYIYVFPRMGYSHNCFALHPTIIRTQAPIIEISSTQIRDRIHSQKSIRYLVSESIRTEVEQAYDNDEL